MHMIRYVIILLILWPVAVQTQTPFVVAKAGYSSSGTAGMGSFGGGGGGDDT